MSTPNKLNSLHIKEIRKLRREGMTVTELGHKFGVTSQTISYHTKGINPRLERIFRPVARIDEAKVLYLYALGHSQSEIARQVGANPSTICKALARMEARAA